MSPSSRVLLNFLKNRCRATLGLSGVRKVVILAIAVCAIYTFVYYIDNTPRVRENTERYPNSIRNPASQGANKVTVLPSDTAEHPQNEHNHVLGGQDMLKNNPKLPKNGLNVVHSVWRETLPNVLLLFDRNSANTMKVIQALLEAQRVPFTPHRCTGKDKTPPLTLTEEQNGQIIGRFSLIISADTSSFYGSWDVSTQLQKYCREFNVTLVLLSKLFSDQIKANFSKENSLGHLKSSLIYSESVLYLELSTSSTFYYAKPGQKISKIPPVTLWNVFEPVAMSHDRHVTNGTGHVISEGGHVTRRDINNDAHVRTVQSHVTSKENHMSTVTKQQLLNESHSANYEVLLNMAYNNLGNSTFKTAPAVLLDRGLVDGIRRVFIGGPVTFWLMKLLLLDVIRSMSVEPILRFGRERWVMVDIDDMFVAAEGLKMTPSDVQALIEAQQQFRKLVPGFTFNLGFCGQYYTRGTAEEILGSQAIVRNASYFWWFGHIYNHYQPHSMSEAKLRSYMHQNVKFAKSHSIPAFDNHYAVSPHHSGTYPIYPPLYTAWGEIWNVTMTTTEEYPHLRPDHMRRGFVHRGVMVLPRQTCRLFTHTYMFDFFKGGRENLISLAEGEEIFNTLLNNPVSIFMTHVTNYANDRLALTLFNALFNFVAEWTQLELITERPLTLSRKYFEIFPEDKMPLWTSPCDDKRHLEIWPEGKNCSRFPSLLILGPQKSGTTALYTFLKVHPQIESNFQTKGHFEEVQFFSNDDLYQCGIDWYMDQFPVTSSHVLFEKSATYFTHPQAPLRVYTLLPEAKLIVILHDPIKRAYSWYQHMVAHGDPTALSHSFSEVIRSSLNQTMSDKRVLSLSSHSLLPGIYHEHIARWLQFYHSEQLFFVDGDELVEHPAKVMDSVQLFLSVTYFNYWDLLRYDQRKGFYCLSSASGRSQCLGASKGRHYPTIPDPDREFLEKYYSTHNLKLFSILKELSRPIPRWLASSIG